MVRYVSYSLGLKVNSVKHNYGQSPSVGTARIDMNKVKKVPYTNGFVNLISTGRFISISILKRRIRVRVARIREKINRK